MENILGEERNAYISRTLSEHTPAFNLTEDQFRKNYHFEKPEKSQTIVLSPDDNSKDSIYRADRAAIRMRVNDGYFSLFVYKGGFADWKTRGGDIDYPSGNRNH